MIEILAQLDNGSFYFIYSIGVSFLIRCFDRMTHHGHTLHSRMGVVLICRFLISTWRLMFKVDADATNGFVEDRTRVI